MNYQHTSTFYENFNTDRIKVNCLLYFYEKLIDVEITAYWDNHIYCYVTIGK